VFWFNTRVTSLLNVDGMTPDVSALMPGLGYWQPLQNSLSSTYEYSDCLIWGGDCARSQYNVGLRMTGEHRLWRVPSSHCASHPASSTASEYA